MVSYAWLGTGLDSIAAVACFLCVLPHCAVGTSNRRLASTTRCSVFFQNPSLCSELLLTFLGSFNCFIPEPTRGLWRLQFWLLVSCRPPFLAELPSPIQPASARKEKTHPAVRQPNRKQVFPKKHVYKTSGWAILIRAGQRRRKLTWPSVDFQKANLLCLLQSEAPLCFIIQPSSTHNRHNTKMTSCHPQVLRLSCWISSVYCAMWNDSVIIFS